VKPLVRTAECQYLRYRAPEQVSLSLARVRSTNCGVSNNYQEQPIDIPAKYDAISSERASSEAQQAGEQENGREIERDWQEIHRVIAD